MTGRDMDVWEHAAGNIAAGVLGGRAVPRDVPGAPDATHDFDIELAGCRSVALEVTSAIEQEMQRLRVASSKPYPAPTLVNNWWIVIGEAAPGDEQVNLRKITKGLVPVLEVYERLGLTEVETRESPEYRRPAPGVPTEVLQATLKQFELGAAVARVWGQPESSCAQLFVGVSGGVSGSVDRVNDLIVAEAHANHAKLAAADGDERHLFVWLSQTHADAELAVFTGPPPATPPELPAGIDVVWLATRFADGVAERLWRVRPPGEWEVLERPQPS